MSGFTFSHPCMQSRPWTAACKNAASVTQEEVLLSKQLLYDTTLQHVTKIVEVSGKR